MRTLDKTLVIPDLHGRLEFLKAVAKRYDPSSHNLVIAGDIVNGPNVPDTIDLAMDMKAKLVMGNHDWTMLAAMFEGDDARRYEWCEQRWRRYGTAMLSSYGIETPPSPKTAQRLKQRLQKRGHLDYLHSAPLFHEGTSALGHYVVTHAGISGTNWVQQRAQLDIAKQDQEDGNYGDPIRPIPQLFGSAIINLASETPKKPGFPLNIRGHYHSTTPETMLSPNGKVITLATGSTEFNGKTPEGPIFVFESWSGEIRPIQAA